MHFWLHLSVGRIMCRLVPLKRKSFLFFISFIMFSMFFSVIIIPLFSSIFCVSGSALPIRIFSYVWLSSAAHVPVSVVISVLPLIFLDLMFARLRIVFFSSVFFLCSVSMVLRFR